MATLDRTNSIYLSGVLTQIGQPQCTAAGTFYQQFSLYREVESEKGVRTELIPLGVIGEELVTQLSSLQDNQPVLVKGKLDVKIDKVSGKTNPKITVLKLIPTTTVVKENYGIIFGNVTSFYNPETNKPSDTPILTQVSNKQKTVFSVAYNVKKFDESLNKWVPEDGKFFSFECWNGTASVLTNLEKGLTKGTKVAIQYSVKYEVYKEQGRFTFLVNDIQFSRKNVDSKGHTKPQTNEDADISDIPF